ncbi:MAG: twin-arginine translocation signal domain-containing protein, partial [FCB group bacterium]|nr:twin-arginine translocation signal domain-containing protein [FCB group bacterium]
MERKPLVTSRRDLLRTAGIAACAAQLGLHLPASAAEPAANTPAPQPLPKTEDTFATQAKGIRILPGQWRPHYPWEHIAWVSPAWPSQDYIWLDCPEAIFTNRGLLFLSHINPPIPTIFGNLPKVPWK